MSKHKLGKAKAASLSRAGGGSMRPRKGLLVIQYPVKVGRITREVAEAAVDAVMRERREGGMPSPSTPAD